ncbi:MAG: galactonate dehydratase [Geminicoccaceae bacterium]
MSDRRDCRIIRVETHLVGTRWCNWVFARLFTDDGITGVGEGTCEWQAKAVEAAIRQLAERHVIGHSAFAIERLWQAMFRNEFARGGPILNSAIGAIEIAMWDIVGKALDRPVHELLGGRVHERVPAYANAWYGAGADAAAIAAAARAVRDKGYPGLKLDPFESSGRDPDHALIRQAVDRVAAVRDAVGPEMAILIDCHGRFSPASAIAIAQELEPYRLYWFEEPCDPENVAALAKVGRSIRTRLATGERCYTKYHLQALLRDCEVGVLQPDIMHVGGILEAKKIAAIADASYIPVSYHNPFGPVATAAALQLDACTTNFIMQESFCEFSEPWRFDLLEQAPRPANGQYEIPTGPGLGVGEFQVEVARAHPFDPNAFLPMWSDAWRRRF